MLSKILILTALSFATLYPLFSWIRNSEVIETGFYRFNFGFSSLIGIFGTIALWSSEILTSTKIIAVIWIVSLLMTSGFFWKRHRISWLPIIFSSSLGMGTLLLVQSQLIGANSMTQVITILGGAILAASVFSGVLGHWYLNVMNLPIELLEKTVQIFWIFLLGRLIWNLYSIAMLEVVYLGAEMPIWKFIQTIDGILLLVPLFFGTLFPAVLLHFARETVKIGSTQSATGILYVISISILMGDFAYKYYLFQYGLVL